MAITRIGPNQSINLASNVTGTLPTGNGGTGATSFAPGKVLQVQSFNTTDNMSTTSTSFVASAVTDSITCSATSSKVLVLVNGGRGSFSGSAEGTVHLYYQEGSGSFSSITNIIIGNRNESGGYGKPSMSFSYLHSPSSTSALNYKVYFKTDANTYFLNSDSSQVNITLMEIAG